MSKGVQAASAGATYRLLRELGSRGQHTYAALREPQELVVVQRFTREGAPRASARGDSASDRTVATVLDAEPLALLLRDARCLERNWHPNIARVRHVDLAGGELTIASEMIDGATLEDLFAAAKPERASSREPLLPLGIVARVVLDVLAGLTALHALRDGMSAPLGMFHGELCPANVIVGRDGVARIVNALRARPVHVATGSEAVGYAAPEVLESGRGDARSDVYSVGVMLWEALTACRLHDERVPARVLARQREGDSIAPLVDPTSPFAGLAGVAMTALAFDAGARFRSASEMAAAIRKAVGAQLASGSLVAARVADLAGDRIRVRRAELDPAHSGTRRKASTRAIAAARAAVEERESHGSALENAETASGPVALDGRPSLAGPTYDEHEVPTPPNARPGLPDRVVPASLPPLPPPVPLRVKPRVAGPTLQTDVPVSLLELTRMRGEPGSAPEIEIGPAARVDDATQTLDLEDDEDEDLPGPRGSSPEIAVEPFPAELAAPRPTARRPLTPLEPHVPTPEVKISDTAPTARVMAFADAPGAAEDDDDDVDEREAAAPEALADEADVVEEADVVDEVQVAARARADSETERPRTTVELIPIHVADDALDGDDALTRLIIRRQSARRWLLFFALLVCVTALSAVVVSFVLGTREAEKPAPTPAGAER